MKDDHIYTLSRNVKALKRKLGMHQAYTLLYIDVKASTDCHINTRDEPFECRIIEGIDYILKYTEKDEYTMFYKGTDV